MKGHKISLTILYDSYIAQAKLLKSLISELEDAYDYSKDETETIAELYLLHDHMLDNAEELSCHLICGRIKTKKVYDRKERKYERRTQ